MSEQPHVYEIKMADVNGAIRTIKINETDIDAVFERIIITAMVVNKGILRGLDGNAVNLNNIVEIISIKQID